LRGSSRVTRDSIAGPSNVPVARIRKVFSSKTCKAASVGGTSHQTWRRNSSSGLPPQLRACREAAKICKYTNDKLMILSPAICCAIGYLPRKRKGPRDPLGREASLGRTPQTGGSHRLHQVRAVSCAAAEAAESFRLTKVDLFRGERCSIPHTRHKEHQSDASRFPGLTAGASRVKVLKNCSLDLERRRKSRTSLGVNSRWGATACVQQIRSIVLRQERLYPRRTTINASEPPTAAIRKQPLKTKDATTPS
jgi:hypothetical protein